MRRLVVFIAVACISATLATGFAQRNVEAEKRDDYAIYSKVIQCFDELCLIEAETVPETTSFSTPGDNPSACITAPAADATLLGEIRADYERRKNLRTPLGRDFTFSRPYMLMVGVEAERFLKDALEASPQILPPGGVIPRNTHPLSSRAGRIFRLSNVYYNLSRTFAVVYVAAFETPYDAMGGWHVFNKASNGDWEGTRTWRTCGWGSAR